MVPQNASSSATHGGGFGAGAPDFSPSGDAQRYIYLLGFLILESTEQTLGDYSGLTGCIVIAACVQVSSCVEPPPVVLPARGAVAGSCELDPAVRRLPAAEKALGTVWPQLVGASDGLCRACYCRSDRTFCDLWASGTR